LSVLFAPAARPDASSIIALKERTEGFSVSSRQAGTQSHSVNEHSLELLVDGLVFDLFGLAPGKAARVSGCEHLVDIEEDADALAAKRLEAITLTPGSHLRGGEAMMPVVRTMCGLAARLSELPGVEALAWHPACICISPTYFRAAIAHWLEDGPFPAPGLTALKPTPDGGMQSVGMAFFTGQELRIEPELADDRKAAARLAARLVNKLLDESRLERETYFELPDGSRLLLAPSPNGRFVRVWPA
jgi:hypothetical protein